MAGGPSYPPTRPHQPPVYQPPVGLPDRPAPTRPPAVPVGNMPPAQPAPVQGSVEFVSLAPNLVSANGKTIRGSHRAAPRPAVNGMVKAPYPSRVAYRDIEVQFNPPRAFANTAVRWQFQAFGGRLRGRLPGGTPVFSTPPGVPGRFDRLDARGRTKVRVSMPPKGLNRGLITVTSAMNPLMTNSLDFAVPAVIVIDPGHGGHVNLAGSSANNSRTPQGVLEKDLTLAYGKELAKAVTQIFEGRGLHSRVAMTRDRDINVSGQNRAELARDLGADAFVTIHFNGFDGTKRGTLEVQRSAAKGNVNFREDTNLANRLVAASVNALRLYDRGAYKRAPVPFATSVSSDRFQGNTSSNHPVRHAYLELEFIDNPAVATLLTGRQQHQVRASVAGAMAQAIFDDIASHQG